MASVNTPLGEVRIANKNAPIPQGWRVLTLQEGQQVQAQLRQIMTEWSIVAFDTGAYTGSGYHHELKQTVGNECGEVFVIKQGGNQQNPSMPGGQNNWGGQQQGGNNPWGGAGGNPTANPWG